MNTNENPSILRSVDALGFDRLRPADDLAHLLETAKLLYALKMPAAVALDRARELPTGTTSVTEAHATLLRLLAFEFECEFTGGSSNYLRHCVAAGRYQALLDYCKIFLEDIGRLGRAAPPAPDENPITRRLVPLVGTLRLLELHTYGAAE